MTSEEKERRVSANEEREWRVSVSEEGGRRESVSEEREWRVSVSEEERRGPCRRQTNSFFRRFLGVVSITSGSLNSCDSDLASGSAGCGEGMGVTWRGVAGSRSRSRSSSGWAL